MFYKAHGVLACFKFNAQINDVILRDVIKIRLDYRNRLATRRGLRMILPAFIVHTSDFCLLAGDPMKYFKHTRFLLAFFNPFNLAF